MSRVSASGTNSGLRKGGYWSDNRTFGEAQDNLLFNRVFLNIWKNVPRKKPLQVGVSLTDLVEASQYQEDLFDKPRNATLTKAIDALNEKYGRGQSASAWRLRPQRN